MHHFIYETTNLINNKKYIGKHSTDNIDDGYLGSGKILLRAINKYGKENFQRKILLIVGSEEDAYYYEEKLVTTEIIESDDYYNIHTGGCGFNSNDIKGEKNPFYGKHHTEETKKKLSNMSL